MDLETTPKLDALLAATNVCTLLSDKDVETIGVYALDGYTADKGSRKEWEQRSAFAMKLALQVVQEKSFPWPNASNVKFPLVTVAAMQYQARAYPALVNANDLVKCRVFGEDPDGSKNARAKRISEHMSWQNLEQDTGWEEDQDKLTLVQAINGCAFKKRIFDPAKSRQTAKLVLPDNFVINYWCKDLESAPRYTHTFYLQPNDIRQRVLDGRYREIVKTAPDPTAEDRNDIKIAQDQRQGLEPPPDDQATPYFTGEQFCWMDLDGDGYEEPYIVTFDIGNGKVRRIVARFLPSGIKRKEGKKDGPIYEITPVRVFTKYPFVPSPDGGFYDLGLGNLEGPLNESVNTIINQMIDASTMALLGGGFVGRGFKSKAGPFTFQPNQWFPVDAPGDDLRKNILPLPVREASAVMFQLLGMLVQYGEKIVSSTDLQMGENIGQNTPAETTRTLNENGSRVYNAIYKRTWRAMRDEFRVQYELNALFLEHDEDYKLLQGMIQADDYRQQGVDVRPAADPHIVSDGERVKQAQLVLANAMQIPGHNRYQSLLRYYKAIQVPNIDEILPPPQQPGPDGKPQPATDFPPPPNPKLLEVQIKQADQQLRQQEFQAEQQKAMIELQQEAIESQANVAKLYAQATLLLAEAKGAEVEPQIKLLYAQIESEGKRGERIMKMVDIISNHMLKSQEKGDGADKPQGSGVGKVEAGPANAGVPQLAAPVRSNGAGVMA